MNPGDLDTPILIQRLVDETSPLGDALPTYVELDRPWAKVVHMKGQELQDAQQVVAHCDTKFIIRMSDVLEHLSTKCVVIHDEEFYNILESLAIPGGRPTKIEILAQRRADP